MSRKQRIEFPDACYHVLNRGNYRSWIFEEDSTKALFEETLFQACVRSDWLLHAHVVMGNHFHLALQTPQANLVEGMHWLESTFSVRFNRRRHEMGHLFQGRYKALLVQDGSYLSNLCDYIHLNPVRAGIVPLDLLHSHRYGSYARLSTPSKRPPFLQLKSCLALAGGLPDNEEGWALYKQYLLLGPTDFNCQEAKGAGSMSKGWAIGSDAYKADLVRKFPNAEEVALWDMEGIREIRELRWKDVLNAVLQRLGPLPQTTADLRAAKIQIARTIKQECDASNAWIALQLGFTGSRYVSAVTTKQRAPASHPHRHHALHRVGSSDEACSPSSTEAPTYPAPLLT